MPSVVFPIRVVAEKTGLSAHVIRIWEKRYRAVRPHRTVSNRRLYSAAEVERLIMLRRATEVGHRIGDVASLSETSLRALAPIVSPEVAPALQSANGNNSILTSIESAIAAILAMQAEQLERILAETAVRLGQRGALLKLVAPLVARIGELWHAGDLHAANEHFATGIIRAFVLREVHAFVARGDEPVLVVTTPPGHLHELGAALVAAAARDEGWKVVYLGPSLPAAEIASAARQNRAHAVALSIVYPEDDAALPGVLDELRRLLPEETEILAGGRAAAAYSGALERIGAVRVGDLRGLSEQLDAVRRRRIR